MLTLHANAPPFGQMFVTGSDGGGGGGSSSRLWSVFLAAAAV